MASDYKKIAEEHEKRYGWDAKPRRIYKKLYSDKTHFIYELIQNADDSDSGHLKLQLDSNALLVWNDGCRFKEKDVRSICSLGSSDKDLTDIGTFGIGFKAVYNYTDLPEIYSGCERFRIREFIKPEGIDEMTPKIKKLVEEGKTVFRLPFKGNRRQAEDIEHLKDRLCNLSKERPLLFLRSLERIEGKDERNAQTGFYSCHRHSYDKIQDVPDNQSIELVNLTGALESGNELSETFLVFCQKIHPPKDVIDKLSEQAEDEEDEEEQQRIQQSAEELQPIEVAFKLQDDRITAMDDNCVLFAYLPTQKETHLKFLIQARYQTTPARDNIPKPNENPWNKWLVKETADYLPEILEQLKTGGLLEPAFFNALPLKGEVENEFKPIAKALSWAMRERAFVPTEKEGHYAQADNVFYPDSNPLRELVKSSGMHPDSSLLHPDIQESGRCFKVMAEAGIKKIDKSDLLFWLEKQSHDWFKKRTHKWMRSLYAYFNKKWSESEWERIRKIRLVRLKNREHVCVDDQLVCFPPNTGEEREEIKPFLNELPILHSALLKGDDRNDIEAFLDGLGIKVFHPENIISGSICPLYNQPDKPLIMKNRWHVRYIFESWQKAEEYERIGLEESISEVPILRACKGIQREDSDFVVPCKAYLPEAYTGDNDLETYFSVSDGAFWFVDDKYLRNKSDTKAWFQFLKAIGAMNTPQVIKRNIPVDYKECNDRSIQRASITRTGEEIIEDHSLEGLSVVLNEISEHRSVKLSQVLWSLLVKALPLAEQERETFFKEIYKGTYYSKYRSDSYTKSDHFDAAFYLNLRSVAWIPDEQGNLHSPSECFMPTSENQEILGDSVTYVHSDFDMNTRPAQWLAKKLNIRLEADADNVLNYLQTLSQKEASIEKVEPLYRFLYDTRPRREVNGIFTSYMVDPEPSWRAKFKKERLIFIPEPKPHWWRTDKVFWEDERPVFGDERGYLKTHYSEDLKSFFTASLKVPPQADTLDYVGGIQDITSKGQAGTKEIRDLVQKLYRRLWLSLQEKEDMLEDEEWQEEWAQVRGDACWLGKKGEEWGFFSSQELVWKDDDHRSELFKNEVPFWGFDNGLLELAKELGVKGCYQDSDIVFDYYGDQEEDADWSVKVRDLSQNIRDFLNSPHLCGEHGKEKSTEILDRLSVRRVERLEVRFELKGVPVPDPNPLQSFLEATDQEATLWLALEADENQYAWLIGDALQDYFRDVKELSGFVEDLLTKNKENVLTRWKQKGLRTNIVLPSPEDSEEDEKKPLDPGGDEFPDETGDGSDPGADDSDVGTPTVNGNTGIGKGSPDSTTNGSDNPSGPSGTSRSSGHSLSTSSNKPSGGGHGGSGGGGESDEHRELKEHLAENTFELDIQLELVKVEHTFGSGDRVDILLKDDSGNPVTVEVETDFSYGAGRYVGVWQAVKYQHLAAMECGIECKQVRSILAAPEIPEDVKEKCKELGIEPIEVSNQTEA